MADLIFTPEKQIKQITLSNGLVTLVDSDWYEMLAPFRWHGAKSSSGYYAVFNWRRSGKDHTESMHRVIMAAVRGTIVDHKNGDTLDNRRSNLRLCTHQQNSRNRKAMTGSTSKYKGVSRCSTTAKWTSTFRVGKKMVYLGVFETEEEAALAYNEAIVKVHGEFARLNVIVPNV